MSLSKLFFVLFAMLLSGGPAGAVEILDPHKVLEDIGHWVPSIDFQSALTCGGSVEYSADTTNCDHNQCYGANTPTGRFKVQLFSENCTADSVSVYGDNGLSMEVTKDDFTRGKNTLLIPLLKNLGHFMQPEGDITLTFAFPMRQFDYVHDGIKERINGVWVMGDIETGTANSQTVDIVLSSSQTGVAQVLLLSDGINEFLRLKGVFDVKR